MQETNEFKKEIIDSIDKEPEGPNSMESWLKRKVNEEQSADEKIESTSKKKRNNSKENAENTKDFQGDIKRETMVSIKNPEGSTYSLLVSNFPGSWSFQQVCNYVALSLDEVSVEMEPVVGNGNDLRLTFNSADHRLSAQNSLQNKEIEGSKLHVVVEVPVDDDNDSVKTIVLSDMSHDIWDLDPKGLYGLKEDYLKTLNIIPPIGKWVHVTNFRCDKSELRDIFELAGNVLACCIVNTKEKYAKVMFSHPLEAVQAVSMLNDQMFYGKNLCVTMDRNINSEMLLPKGLASVGPGLGEDGMAVREITREYERFLKGKSTKINPTLFTAGNINGIVVTKKLNYTVMGVNNTENNLPSSIPPKDINPNPTPASVRPSPLIRPVMRPNFGQDVRPHGASPMFRGPVPGGPMMGPVVEMNSPGPFHRGFPPGPMTMPFSPRPPLPGPMPPPGPIRPGGPMCPPGPIHSHVPMTPVPGTSPNWPNPQPPRLLPRMSKCLDASTLKISNLPPTTTFPSLCGKLSTLAQVTSLEFTTPGCAVVKFASPSDAEKCFHMERQIMNTFWNQIIKASTKP